MGLGGFIEFKGTKDGIVLQFLQSGEFEKILYELKSKISNAGSFFKGAEIIGTEGIEFSPSDKEKLKHYIESEFGISVKSLDHYQKKNFVKVENEQNEVAGIHSIFTGLEEGMTKFVKGTMRSGRSVFYAGNVIIMGDVNPGAEVVAFGNIVVMGTLRGVAHAGANGNENAFVAANKLQPTQLRIAGRITSSPDHTEFKSETPEMALIKNDTIIIESYL